VTRFGVSQTDDETAALDCGVFGTDKVGDEAGLSEAGVAETSCAAAEVEGVSEPSKK
jgi:hypothetical protein